MKQDDNIYVFRTREKTKSLYVLKADLSWGRNPWLGECWVWMEWHSSPEHSCSARLWRTLTWHLQSWLLTSQFSLHRLEEGVSLLMEDEESFFLCLVLLYLSPDFNIFFVWLRQDFVGFLTPYVTEDDFELLILLPSQMLGLLVWAIIPSFSFQILLNALLTAWEELRNKTVMIVNFICQPDRTTGPQMCGQTVS